jgi:hypothetical protein
MSQTNAGGPLLWAAVGFLAGGLGGWWLLVELAGTAVGIVGGLLAGEIVGGLAFASSAANGGGPPPWLWPARK